MSNRDLQGTVESQAAVDHRFMGEALALARGVPDRTWPNPPVGALVVRDGVVVGRGAHEGAGQPHAEPVALQEAGEKARGATLYVTLEPCNHQGRTAPCAPAVAASGITRVVVAIRDPNPRVSGGGCRFLRDRGLEVAGDVRSAEALELIWPFVATNNFAHLYVELKTATSLDGCFAPPQAMRQAIEPVYLTGASARHDVHRRRRRVDLVLVGEGTVRADHPRLDGRLAAADSDVPRQEPLAGYVDSDLSWTGGFGRDSYLVFAGESTRDTAGRAAVEKDGGQIVFCPERGGRIAPADVLVAAAERRVLTMLLEGGPRLAASFLAAGVVDRWLQYLAPAVLGHGVRWPGEFGGGELPHRQFSPTRSESHGDDLLVIHDRMRFSDVLAEVMT